MLRQGSAHERCSPIRRMQKLQREGCAVRRWTMLVLPKQSARTHIVVQKILCMGTVKAPPPREKCWNCEEIPPHPNSKFVGLCYQCAKNLNLNRNGEPIWKTDENYRAYADAAKRYAP